MVRCLLVDSGFPSQLSGELVLTANYLCNRIPHSALQMKTPHKVLYGKDAGPSHLKIIGARVFVPIKDPTKLGHTSKEGIRGFIVRESNSYRVWHRRTRRVVETRNVVLIKTIPQPLQLSTLQGDQSPSLGVTDDTADDNFVSSEEML